MSDLRHISLFKSRAPIKPNRWDWAALCIALAIIVSFASAAKQMSMPFHLGQPLTISLNPSFLPAYALQTVFRMIIALFFSLLFTLIFATWAAKNRQAEKIIIPLIDILQSVPVLAFLSITIVGFIALFPNSLLGPQCAAIFLIFTAQAWNMALSFYQSLKTIPQELIEAANMFHLSVWQRFWRIEVPFAMPGLLWNVMLSMSASWFALVASEAITVSNQTINLPGIGSYISLAIQQADLYAVAYAIIAMLAVILIYDQLLLQPLVSWSEKFKFEDAAQEKTSRSWVINILQRTHVLRYCSAWFAIASDAIINCSLFRRKNDIYQDAHTQTTRGKEFVWNTIIIIAALFAGLTLYRFIAQYITLVEALYVVKLGCITALRVIALIILCSLVWVPIGVWIGLRPRLTNIIQPIAQFLAAFPANLLFPVAVYLIVRYRLNVEVWTTPLMILGAQWYILFNVIAGAAAIPKDLKQVTANFGVSGWLWWRKLILPAIFPFYVTGAITAVGGAWNASLVAEVVRWGNTTLTATGLGAYITKNTGDFVHTILGVSIMCLFVIILNRLIWHPLYRIAQSRYLLN